MIKFGAKCSEEDLALLLSEAPNTVPKVQSYRLTFGLNKNLEISEPYKVVSAH